MMQYLKTNIKFLTQQRVFRQHVSKNSNNACLNAADLFIGYDQPELNSHFILQKTAEQPPQKSGLKNVNLGRLVMISEWYYQLWINRQPNWRG